jgi:hypothetical protein
MKSWKEENSVTHEKTSISKEIRQLLRSNDPSRHLKVQALRERYSVLDLPQKEKRKNKLSNFLKRF